MVRSTWSLSVGPFTHSMSTSLCMRPHCCYYITFLLVDELYITQKLGVRKLAEHGSEIKISDPYVTVEYYSRCFIFHVYPGESPNDLLIFQVTPTCGP